MTHPMYSLLGSRPKRSYKFIPVIIKIVSRTVDIPEEKIVAKTRKREIVEARQICMRISKDLTKCSLARIGMEIGRKDHATVLHAIKVVNNLIETSQDFKSKYEIIYNNVLSYVDNSNNFVCPICGGIDILIKAWVNPNLDRFVRYFDEESAEITDSYCNYCKAHVLLILGKEFDYDEQHTVETLPDRLQEFNPIRV